MKTRIISGTVLGVITIAAGLAGGVFVGIALLFCSLIGYAELIRAFPAEGGRPALVLTVDPAKREASFADDVPNPKFGPACSSENFKIGCHYYFYAPDTITNVTLIAFELGQPGGPYTMDRTLSDRLYCSTTETDQRLRELDAEASEIPRKIQDLRDERCQDV